ncbi:sulfotransferase domain-containing protein [uncultured Eudoraea sp.]|uniref:sulfotransferase domain-containing protein n=1 Tax=uncultured Eudoraea sp. TaxID=1035614 RepID=UPI002619EC8F|nr:sulfotransferase domain-containing protein [uncultured Eudoraea sp.]
MKKPNLFILGAPKCGTTFLFETFKRHPRIFLPRIKELNYFSFYQLKIHSYYKDLKTKSLNKYLRYYKKAKSETYLVDASVSYFTFDEVPKAIKEFNSEAKIIFMVRNPYKRAFSHYLMDKRMGYAPKPFSEYLNDESTFHFRQYVHNSLYYKEISKYFEHFDRSNILILELESLKENYTSIFQFLNIAPIEINFEEKVNENKNSRNWIGRIVQKNRGFTERTKLLFPDSFSNKFKSLLYKKAEKCELSSNDFISLQSFIEEDYMKFKSLNNDH